MACDTDLEISAGASPGEFTTRVVHAASGGEPSVVSPGEQQLRQVGQQLFDALFNGAVLSAYRASLRVASTK